MMKKEVPVQEPVETPEQLEERRSQSESQYVRDMAFLQRMADWRASQGRGWIGGF
jgi:hypothetical protein